MIHLLAPPFRGRAGREPTGVRARGETARQTRAADADPRSLDDVAWPRQALVDARLGRAAPVPSRHRGAGTFLGAGGGESLDIGQAVFLTIRLDVGIFVFF